MFKGSIPALITPFKKGEIDWKAFENLVEWQVEQGSHAVVPCGTTGESPTLTHDEHNAIVERCVKIVNKRIPVIAGTGSNSTKDAIEFTKHAKKAGADAALVVTPYYNRPTQEGLYHHYKALNDEARFPIIVYNVPGRTNVNISDETIARLAKFEFIVGLKDASGDLERPHLLRMEVGDDFCQLTGNDGSTAAFLAQGGHGCISVIANVAPAESAQFQEAWMYKDYETFAKFRDLLAPLSRDVFCETSPAPIKYAASVLGLSTDEVRLPLVKASESARKKVDAAMAHAGLLNKKGAAARAHG